jgi:chaperonin cofactor prefoldin
MSYKYHKPVLEEKLIELERDILELEETINNLDKIKVNKVYQIIGGKILVEYPGDNVREILSDELDRLKAWRNKLIKQLSAE